MLGAMPPARHGVPIGSVKLSEHTRLDYCPDCDSLHIGVNPCGMTWLERMRSTQLAPEACPSRRPEGMYDEDAINGIFGEDAEERMLDETEGVGAVSREELARMTPEQQERVTAFYGLDPDDSKVISGG